MEIIALAQVWVERFLHEGDLAIDATVGNGYDTAFLARRVGSAGRVLGFDLQEIALEATRKSLLREGLLERVTLIHQSHAEMGEALSQIPGGRRPQAIMFNLGYLPGGDKTVTTRTEETLKALDLALAAIGGGGVVTVVLYPGHEEGLRESRAVTSWGEALPSAYDVTLCRPLNRRPVAPFLLVVETPV
jgi:methylase of polypeptide subunit release factors